MSGELTQIPQSPEVARFAADLKMAQDICNVVKASTYGKLFETFDVDPNDSTKQIKVIKDEDIIANILLGRALGMQPMESIIFGKTLDKMAYFKIMKGKELGFNVTNSLQHVYAYESKDGKLMMGTTAAAINATATKAGVTFQITKDFIRKPYYRTFHKDGKIGTFLGFELNDQQVAINSGISKEEKEAKLAAGATMVMEYFTYVSEAIFHRKGWPDLVESYSLLEATEAGLYWGINFNGNAVEGKPAWNNNPKRVLNTRLIAIGQSRISSDVLNGVITIEELNEIRENEDSSFTPHEEIK